jgi:putative ABC transport system ATP-binding protein
MLTSRNLEFQYPGRPAFSFPDLQCAKSEKKLILGGSGSGKTTLLHLLCGLIKPHAGEIVIAGENICKLNGKNLDIFRGKNIGIVFQTSHFISSLSVAENLKLPGFLIGKTPQDAEIKKMLERLNLGQHFNSKPQHLSVGEQQRMAIARALMNKPPLVMADEPTSALDDKNAAEVIRLLEEQSAAFESALIIVTHDQRLKDHFPGNIVL